MANLEESWLPVASSLGFLSELDMLEHLYLDAGFSLKEMERVIGYSSISIRRRLLMNGVSLRKRGGPNRVGKRRLLAVPDSELKYTPPNEVAATYNVHVSTVFSEKRLRRIMKGEEVWNAVLKTPSPVLEGSEVLSAPLDEEDDESREEEGGVSL